MGSLAKSGTATLTLSGANTYTGSTSVFAGTLTVGAGGAIDNANATSGTLIVSSANNATLNISGGTVNVNGGAGSNIVNVGTGAGAGVDRAQQRLAQRDRLDLHWFRFRRDGRLHRRLRFLRHERRYR